MNENGINFVSKCKSICITCLKPSKYLNPMSFELRNEYIKFVEMVKSDTDMMICNLCCWQFKKCLRFKMQCQAAGRMIKNAQNSKPYLQKLCPSYNLETTKTEVHYFKNMLHTQNEHEQMDRYLGSEQIDRYQGTEHIDRYLDGEQIDGYEQINFEKQENVDDGIDYNNDDEIPLVMLKEVRKKKKKRKVSENGETLKVTKSVPSKKVKRELKQGFTSRMVQETDEYIVIKLTKEQVLQEMEERSKTEAYSQSPFKCEKCVKAFNFQDVLGKHLERHTLEIGSFQCDMCYQYCRSAVSLRGHIKSHTTRYKCKLCGVVRLSRQHLLEHHGITHTRLAATYRCDTCHFNTNKRTVMQRHVRSHVSAEPHACERCGKLFKSIDSLRVHTQRHDKSSRLQCGHCGLGFVYHSLLRRHVARAHERREYYCVECDAQFKSNESLRLHFKKAKKHRDSSTYKHECPQCPSRFFTSSALNSHQSSAHGAPREHACALCRRLYSSRDALRAHLWRAHDQRQTKES